MLNHRIVTCVDDAEIEALDVSPRAKATMKQQVVLLCFHCLFHTRKHET